MLTALSQSPATTQKRMGDGFYEQKLVREQVQALTGQRFLGDYSNDQTQYMALMNNGLTYAKALNLRPGIALSAEQVAQLTSDMVWLVGGHDARSAGALGHPHRRGVGACAGEGLISPPHPNAKARSLRPSVRHAAGR